jgi:hypothetical protein
MNTLMITSLLAETGADSSIVTTLGLIAGALGLAGILLIVVRIVARRRAAARAEAAPAPE